MKILAAMLVAFLALVIYTGLRYDYKLAEAKNAVHEQIYSMVTPK